MASTQKLPTWNTLQIVPISLLARARSWSVKQSLELHWKSRDNSGLNPNFLSKTPAVNTFLGNCIFVRDLVELVMLGCLIYKALKFLIYSDTQPRSRERRSFFVFMVSGFSRFREKRAFFLIEKDKGTWG